MFNNQRLKTQQTSRATLGFEDRKIKRTVLQQSTSDYISQKQEQIPKDFGIGIHLGNYGHSSVKNTKNTSMQNFINDYAKPMTYKQKQDQLAVLQNITASQQIKMFEQNLKKKVGESYKTDMEERNMVKESLMKDFKKVAEKKEKIKLNKQLLSQQDEEIKKLREKIKKEENDLELQHNDQFTKDDTLICAFPRIHVPTITSLKKIKHEKQAKFRAQYDLQVAEKKERMEKEVKADQDRQNQFAQEIEKQGIKKDLEDKVKQQKVNEVCVKEWELRLKAKQHLDAIKKKSKVLENLIYQRKQPQAEGPNNQYSRKGIYNHAYLVKNEENSPAPEKMKDLTGAAEIIKNVGKKLNETQIDTIPEFKNYNWSKNLRQNLAKTPGRASRSPMKIPNISQGQQAAILKENLNRTSSSIKPQKEQRLARALDYLKNFKVSDSKSIIDDLEPKAEHHPDPSIKSTRSKLTKANLASLEEDCPDSLWALLDDVPEELHQYILEEILAEIQNLEISQLEMSKLEASQGKRKKLLSAINKKRLEITSENMQTFKKQRSLITSKVSENKLYPLNMRDETNTLEHELKMRKMNQKKQYKMLLEQENDLKYPKNKESLKLQKEIENQYFTKIAQSAAVQEINEILEERKMKLNNAMKIKADWDMSINLNRLKNEVEINPRKFYSGAGQTTLTLQEPVQDLKQIDTENMKLEMEFSKYKTLQNFDSLIKKVNNDMDKKSVYSKKMQNQHQKEQEKKSKKMDKADDIFTVTTKETSREFFGGPGPREKANKSAMFRTASKIIRKQPLESNENEYIDQLQNPKNHSKMKKLMGNFFDIQRPSTNFDQYNSHREKRLNNHSAETLLTPKQKQALKCKDYFYDNEAMLKMPIKDQFSVGSLSNASKQIEKWEKERLMTKVEPKAPPKYPWENRQSSLNQYTKIKQANE